MKKLMALLLAAGLAFGGASVLRAQDHDHDHDHGDHDHGGEKAGHSHEASAVHGGDVSMTEAHHFEVVFFENGVRVYPYGPKQELLAAKGITGTAKLTKKGVEKSVEQKLTYVPADDKKGTHRDYLEAAFDWKGIEKGGAKITIDLAGLPGEKEPKASFTVTFNGVTPKVEYICPMKCEGGRALDPAKCPKCKMEMKKTSSEGEKDDDHDHHDHH